MKFSTLKPTAVAAAFAVGAMASGSAAQATDLVVVSWGGAYTASQQKAYHEPYMAANPGIKILNDDSAAEGVAKLRAMAEAGNTTWDVVDMVASDAIRACDEGLVEEINYDQDLAAAPDGTPASKDFGDMLVSPCYIPQIVYSTTFGYRTDLVKSAPTTIADVFDLAKNPGKRSLEKRPINNLEWALIADGVDPDKVYDVLSTPAGVDRAFAKLDTIKDHVVWWTKGAQTPQLLADGEVVMGSTYNGRLFSLIAEEKQPVAMLWDWQVFDLDGWVVPSGGKNKAEVMKYLRFATDTQRLADQAKYISYGPARASSAPLVGKHATLGIDMKPHMPTDPNNAKHTLMFNIEWWADHRDELDQRFQAWLTK
ncbi:MAG: ABC transporter substrate-binding protein [Arenicellales bacterium]|jgi:putative spermidine/putrescine transport system substrate-binding protein|nr:ABC transporter substrate-binding protein [Arenicellales bacterium]MDP7155268.1 ABC transporter substrate-binding protein [Arenicellales bacterium]MDP7482136.1 ABC transporter substrate-binding protein [Arenicellales bacterium]MEE1539641.1 ABC transporter substrate-binding protein [Arenicellales bacterium]HJL65314.1 ABC transporter substrate-binding protein [Arenicellales bacterium]|tara:strand:+ start:1489 stop:2592 length:1104 start_codon:yes stop_codon:yes gene_type:complete